MNTKILNYSFNIEERNIEIIESTLSTQNFHIRRCTSHFHQPQCLFLNININFSDITINCTKYIEIHISIFAVTT